MQQELTKKETIKVKPSFRWIENGHILLWLIKDTCWAMVLRPLGIFMIFPTLSVAFYILWKTRQHRAELFHNLAVCLWISANSLWMVGEFYNKDLRHYAIIIFLIGLSLLLIYYIFFFSTDRKKEKEYALP